MINRTTIPFYYILFTHFHKPTQHSQPNTALATQPSIHPPNGDNPSTTGDTPSPARDASEGQSLPRRGQTLIVGDCPLKRMLLEGVCVSLCGLWDDCVKDSVARVKLRWHTFWRREIRKTRMKSIDFVVPEFEIPPGGSIGTDYQTRLLR